MKVLPLFQNSVLGLLLAATSFVLSGCEAPATSSSSSSSAENSTSSSAQNILGISNPSPTSGGTKTTFVFNVNYSQKISSSNVKLSDFKIGGSASGCKLAIGTQTTGSTLIKMKVSGCVTSGTVNLSVVDATSGTPMVSLDATVDTTLPLVSSIAVLTGTPTSGDYTATFTFKVIYSKAVVVNPDISNVVLGGAAPNPAGPVGCVLKIIQDTNTSALVTLKGCMGRGYLTIASLGDGFAIDAQGNKTAEYITSQLSPVTLTNPPPTLTVTPPSATKVVINPPAATPSITYTVNYAGSVANPLFSVSLSSANIIVNYTGNAHCTVTVVNTGLVSSLVTLSSCTGDGSASISIPGAIVANVGGTTNDPSNPSTPFSIYTTPTVVSLAASTNAVGTYTTQYTYTVTFSNPVTFSSDITKIASTTVSTAPTTASCTIDPLPQVNPPSVTASFKVSKCKGIGTFQITSLLQGFATDNRSGSSSPVRAYTHAADTLNFSNSPPTFTLSAPSYPSMTTTGSTPNHAVQYTLTAVNPNGDPDNAVATATVPNTQLTVTGNANCAFTVSNSGNTSTITFTSCTGNGTVGIASFLGSPGNTTGGVAGSSFTPAANSFTALSALVISSISPNPINLTALDTSMTITGSGFDSQNGPPTITIGGAPCRTPSITSPTSLNCTYRPPNSQDSVAGVDVSMITAGVYSASATASGLLTFIVQQICVATNTGMVAWDALRVGRGGFDLDAPIRAFTSNVTTNNSADFSGFAYDSGRNQILTSINSSSSSQVFVFPGTGWPTDGTNDPDRSISVMNSTYASVTHFQGGNTNQHNIYYDSTNDETYVIGSAANEVRVYNGSHVYQRSFKIPEYYGDLGPYYGFGWSSYDRGDDYHHPSAVAIKGNIVAISDNSDFRMSGTYMDMYQALYFQNIPLDQYDGDRIHFFRRSNNVVPRGDGFMDNTDYLGSVYFNGYTGNGVADPRYSMDISSVRDMTYYSPMNELVVVNHHRDNSSANFDSVMGIPWPATPTSNSNTANNSAYSTGGISATPNWIRSFGGGTSVAVYTDILTNYVQMAILGVSELWFYPYPTVSNCFVGSCNHVLRNALGGNLSSAYYINDTPDNGYDPVGQDLTNFSSTNSTVRICRQGQ